MFDNWHKTLQLYNSDTDPVECFNCSVAWLQQVTLILKLDDNFLWLIGFISYVYCCWPSMSLPFPGYA